MFESIKVLLIVVFGTCITSALVVGGAANSSTVLALDVKQREQLDNTNNVSETCFAGSINQMNSENKERRSVNEVQCFPSNIADIDLCAQVLSAGQFSNEVVIGGGAANPSGGAFCEIDPLSRQQCCFSWNKPTERNFLISDVAVAATLIYFQCGKACGVSGRDTNVLIGGTLLTVCLSNRSSGC
jgi:hypothetical protein